jgi:signal transduction histidine kinase
MVCSLSDEEAPARGDASVRVALLGSYNCPATRSIWPLVAAVEDTLGDDVDLRFGHVLGALDGSAARRLAEAAEAARGQGGFARMHAWLMAHPERHDGDASEWADAAGLDVPRFRADLSGGAAASLQAHHVAARMMGAGRGPSLWLGGARYGGALNVNSLVRACQLGHATATATANVAEREGWVQQRDAWVALAGHELRSPLATLRTLTAMMVALREGGIAPNDAQLVLVHREVRRMYRLTKQLTTTAAFRGDYTRPPPCERVELGPLVRHVVEALTYEHGRTNVVVHATTPIYGMWPTEWIDQIVGNLVGNALKFGGAGQVDVDVTGDAALAILVVRDRGPGLAVEDWPRLVRAYERGSGSRGIPGLGLGLYIVHMLVAAMGGRVSVASSPGRGAVFRVVWPTHVNDREPRASVMRSAATTTEDPLRIGPLP